MLVMFAKSISWEQPLALPTLADALAHETRPVAGILGALDDLVADEGIQAAFRQGHVHGAHGVIAKFFGKIR